MVRQLLPPLPAGRTARCLSDSNVGPSLDDVGMGISSGVGAVMEGISASVAALDVLGLEDAVLASGAHGGTDVDVLQRRYELRLERLEVVKRLEGQLAAVKARDVADAVQIQ